MAIAHGVEPEAVARALIHHSNITVVTNNMNVANILAANTDCDVIVTGGSLRRADGGLVGTLAACLLAVAAILFLGEALTTAHALGFALLLGSMLLATWPSRTTAA